MNLDGLAVTVVGAAATGVATARVLAGRGARVTVVDRAAEDAVPAERRDAFAAVPGVACVWASEALPADCALVVPSPGVRRTAGPLRAALERGVPVLSEIEIGYRIARAPILAITGTNGKTTTTAMLAHVCAFAGRTVHACGNLAADAGERLPLIEAADRAGEGDLLVAEVSSFQLEWTRDFRPRAAAWLNLSQDHMDAYPSMEAYAADKAKLLRNQTPDDLAVLNASDPWVVEGARDNGRGRRVWFDGSDPALPAALGLGSKALRVPGRHNVANAAAAAAMALDLGIAPATVAAALVAFEGVPHRMEWVADIDGVRYINNSMCTNPAAVAASLDACDGAVVVIAGGRDKGADLAAIAEPLARRARAVVLIGEAAPRLADALRAVGAAEPLRAQTMQAAVEAARRVARPGETVLLAPGCASFDMFRGFEDRGQAFRDAVRGLARR